MAGPAPTDPHFYQNAPRGAGPLQRLVIPPSAGRENVQTTRLAHFQKVVDRLLRDRPT